VIVPTKIKLLLPLLTLFALCLLPLAAAQGSTQAVPSSSATGDLISAVNTLRIANGRSALKTHTILMQIAQTEAEGIAAGMSGHWRPNNITLGQWLLLLGYPLAGDLSLDGFRSENWVMGTDLTVQGAIEFWKGDEPHLNTMLSENRSDIGGGVATYTDEWGGTVNVYVLETALQTTNGQMPYDAGPTLTALAMIQGTAVGNATQVALSYQVPQYIVPVTLATARPDGDVIHEVKNGQSLWSIAIAYGVKMEQIRRLNGLSSDEIYSGEKLLVQKGATRPAPTATASETPTSKPMTPTPLQTLPSTPQAPDGRTTVVQKSNTFRIGGIVIGALVLGGLLMLVFSKKK